MAVNKKFPSSRLYVPIHIDALVCNEANQKNTCWKDISLNLKNLKRNGGLGPFMERGIEQKGNKEPIYENGIHLHWVLPKSFRHGIYNEKNNTWDYPLVPNRWLVVRSDSQLNLKSWVVESDYIDESAENGFNWIKNTQVKSDPITHKFDTIKVGKVWSIEDWEEQPKNNMFLTIMAPGNPEFAASYLHCKDVFGLHDPMEDLLKKEDTFSYRVYGWFSDATKNPLAAIKTEKDFRNKLEEFAWTNGFFNDVKEVVQENDIPNGILCHSMIHKVEWNSGINTNVPPLSDMEISIGNSTSEAVAAMLKNNISGNNLTMPKQLLASYQYHCLKDSGLQDNWTSTIEQQRHLAGFTTSPGGTLWAIEPKEDERSLISSKKQEDEKSQKEKNKLRPFKENISKKLEYLNKLQVEYDKEYECLKSQQAQLYALKYKETLLKETDTEVLDVEKKKNDFKLTIIKKITIIENLKLRVSALKSEKINVSDKEKKSGLLINTHEGEIISCLKELSKMLLIDPDLNNFYLKEISKPSFYEPKDPVIVIEGLNPSEKYIYNKNTICRTLKQLAEKITIPIKDKNYEINTTDIINGPPSFLQSNGFPDEISGLFMESLFFDSNVVNLIVAKLSSLSNISAEEIQSIVEDFLKTEYKEALSKGDNTKSIFTRQDENAVILPESFSSCAWKQPWVPLYMEWEIKWHKTYEGSNDFSSEEVFKNWKFNVSKSLTDFQCALTSDDFSLFSTYAGRTILTHDLVNLVPELSDKLNVDLFKPLTPMSQQLSGFGNQLIMRANAVELPILDKNFETDPICLSIEDEYKWHPMPDSKEFFPLRGGLFSFNSLRVVDTFGQVVEVIDEFETKANPETYRSAALPLYSKEDDKDKKFILPPRFVQPTRLAFNWLSANHEKRITDSDPITNPVFGWLLYNQFNKSIIFYNSEGIELLELKKTKQSVVYNLPQSKTTSDLIELESIINVKLKSFIKAVLDNKNVFETIEKRIKTVSEKTTLKTGLQKLSMILPIGNPIALVSAECVLELKGQPAVNQHWDSSDPNTNYTSKFTLDAFLGDEKSTFDGLLGYFKDENYAKLHLPMGADNLNESKIPVSFKSPINISLLMDPRMSVKLSSGILPAESYSLPNDIIAASLESIKLRLLIAPILSPISKFEMPLPKSPDVEWNWISRDGEIIIEEEPKATSPQSLTFPALQAIEGWLTIKAKIKEGENTEENNDH